MSVMNGTETPVDRPFTSRHRRPLHVAATPLGGPAHQPIQIDVTHLAWQAQANCRDTDTDLFFPHSGPPEGIARRLCQHCRVTEQCLEYALGRTDITGIWGGTSEMERQRLRRRRREQQKKLTSTP